MRRCGEKILAFIVILANALSCLRMEAVEAEKRMTPGANRFSERGSHGQGAASRQINRVEA